ncbi:SRPBCC family protein [Nocardia sp. NBC_00508]|uniref:SRPBCC family protein n=1 Tax=Nocardia sp. NBC_00508 TaxID=2975992 RepID=UPI002E7FFF28|nr:SRPBCC family protein [Nocardia sp. NBC_00508]WUD66138.1 SRPBCC family protein [Nocardia sp. NBC_00508]
MTDTRPSSTPTARAASDTTRRSGRATLLGIALTAGILAATATPSLADRPAADPASLTCEGKGIDPGAPIHYRTEALIKAPLDTIWNLQTDVERWPSWQQAVTSMERLDSGPLQPGSQFRWTTPAPATATTPATTLTITSSVQQMQPGRCIRWTGPAIGDGMSIDGGIHVWTFTPVDDGVLVRTEENWNGAQVEADVPTSTYFLGAGLEAWLADLRTAAEG